MSEFVEYNPGRPSEARPEGMRIEDAELGDVESIASLIADREGGAVEPFRVSIANQITEPPESCRLHVARVDGLVVGYSRVSWFDAPSLPTGWYLSGLIVAPEFRRHGIGRALTEHRLRWLSSRCETVYYFVNERNRASVDLHAALGFREIQRGIAVPGCTFEGGVGILYARP